MLPCIYINLFNFMLSLPNYADNFWKAKTILEETSLMPFIFSTAYLLMILFDNSIRGLEE